MKVKKIITNGWKMLKDHGDIEKIVEFSKTEEKPNGISRVTIGHALRTGQMNEQTFECINKFYKERKERMDIEEKIASKEQLLTDND